MSTPSQIYDCGMPRALLLGQVFRATSFMQVCGQGTDVGHKQSTTCILGDHSWAAQTVDTASAYRVSVLVLGL